MQSHGAINGSEYMYACKLFFQLFPEQDQSCFTSVKHDHCQFPWLSRIFDGIISL